MWRRSSDSGTASKILKVTCTSGIYQPLVHAHHVCQTISRFTHSEHFSHTFLRHDAALGCFQEDSDSISGLGAREVALSQAASRTDSRQQLTLTGT